MINKNIKLCKLLNIKPKYRVSIYSGTHLVDNLDEVKHLLCDLDMNSKDIIKNAIEIYPDLYMPDNLLKLQQAYYSCNKVITLNESDSGSDIIDGFVSKFYNYVLYCDTILPQEVDKFKELVKQTKFKY